MRRDRGHLIDGAFDLLAELLALGPWVVELLVPDSGFMKGAVSAGLQNGLCRTLVCPDVEVLRKSQAAHFLITARISDVFGRRDILRTLHQQAMPNLDQPIIDGCVRNVDDRFIKAGHVGQQKARAVIGGVRAERRCGAACGNQRAMAAALILHRAVAVKFIAVPLDGGAVHRTEVGIVGDIVDDLLRMAGQGAEVIEGPRDPSGLTC